jgi:predicted ATPase
MQLELRPLNVVIGPNGAGKSNLIGAFRLLDQIVQKRLQEYVLRQSGAARILHYGPKVSRNLAMQFDFGRNGYSFTLAPSTDDNLFFIREELTFAVTTSQMEDRYSGSGIRKRDYRMQREMIRNGECHIM